MDKAKVLELLNKLFQGKKIEDLMKNMMVPYGIDHIKGILAGSVDFTPMDVIMLTSSVSTFDPVAMTVSISEDDVAIIKQLREFMNTNDVTGHLKPIV